MGLFDRLKQGLKKTTDILRTDVRDLFKSQGRLVDDQFLDELREKLFKTDMGFDAAEQIIAEVAKNYRARVVTIDDVLATIKKKLLELLAQPDAPLKFAESGPTVIMVCGVKSQEFFPNGAGRSHQRSAAAAANRALARRSHEVRFQRIGPMNRRPQ